MRKLFIRRWHGLPVSIITAVVLVCVLAGGALAYNFFTGGAQATVLEAITWGPVTVGDGAWDNATGQWTVSMYPGEVKSLTLPLNNASSVAINATVSFTGPGDPAPGGNGVYAVPGNGTVNVPLTATATAGVAPGTYVYTITIAR